MYFIPRNNKFYSFIAHLRSSYRYLLTFVVISFIFILWAIIIYLPLAAHIDHSFIKLTQLRQQCQQIDKAKHNCRQLQHSLESFHGDTQFNKSEKAAKNPLQSNLLPILEQAKKSSLMLNQYATDKKIDDQWVTKNSTHFTFTGNLSQIMDFLKKLKKVNFLFGCDYFSLKNIENNSFRLTITLNIISPK